MSGLNPPSDDEPEECPLCMELLELDDMNFYPCSCGYQICRFCWNKIRMEGNGNCPACRSPYDENPADFKPMTAEDLAKIKAEKRMKDQAKKQRISENRKHLANVRVVQRNLVFVVGLSPRLADPEILKKSEYFGKFGKIHKVVINHSTSYAGNQNQGPSASAYVTYLKSEDALRAIHAVNNIFIDGRTLKASLGTTKYCSHFMKNQSCPKHDCMYLHELGDGAASFTKEEMQQGKHTDYERRLHDEMVEASTSGGSSGLEDQQRQTSQVSDQPANRLPVVDLEDYEEEAERQGEPEDLEEEEEEEEIEEGLSNMQQETLSRTSSPKEDLLSNTNWHGTSSQADADAIDERLGQNRQIRNELILIQSMKSEGNGINEQKSPESSNNGRDSSEIPSSPSPTSSRSQGASSSERPKKDMLDFNNHHRQQHSSSQDQPLINSSAELTVTTPSSVFSSATLENVAESFSNPMQHQNFYRGAIGATRRSPLLVEEDDLDFDPFIETQKALAEMMESEKKDAQNSELGNLEQLPSCMGSIRSNVMSGGLHNTTPPFPHLPNHHGIGATGGGRSSNYTMPPTISRAKAPPPGFSVSNMTPAGLSRFTGGPQQQQLDNFSSHAHMNQNYSSRNLHNGGGGPQSDFANQLESRSTSSRFRGNELQMTSSGGRIGDSWQSKDWEDGFRALLPNINVSFGPNISQQQQQQLQQQHQGGNFHSHSQHHGGDMVGHRNPPSLLPGFPQRNLSSNGGTGDQEMQQERMRAAAAAVQANRNWNVMPQQPSNDWTRLDPAIVGGQLLQQNGPSPGPSSVHSNQFLQSSSRHSVRSDSPPNWIKNNIDQLTADSPFSTGSGLGSKSHDLGGMGGAGSGCPSLLHGFSNLGMGIGSGSGGGQPALSPAMARHSQHWMGGSGNNGVGGGQTATPPPGFANAINNRHASDMNPGSGARFQSNSELNIDNTH